MSTDSTGSEPTGSGVEGLDVHAFGQWIEAECPGLLPGTLEASLITGGRSNLTYIVRNAERELVVRRPPLGHVLATAHDMSREYKVISALEPTSVPVPRTYALCQDSEIIGAPFYVMELVDGIAYQRAAELIALGPQRTRTITELMVDTLARLHDVDYEQVGLSDFGRPSGYLGRQVARWKKQLDSSRSRDLPGMDDLIDYLDGHLPPDAEPTIVHGDYRLDNLLVNSSDQITAVLDWEMSTLGDPLTDVAILLAYQQMADTAQTTNARAAVTDAPQAPGYLSVEEILERYGRATGRDVSRIDYHLAFAFFKLAVILEGIHYRHSHGQTLGEGFEGIGDAVIPLINAGLSAPHR